MQPAPGVPHAHHAHAGSHRPPQPVRWLALNERLLRSHVPSWRLVIIGLVLAAMVGGSRGRLPPTMAQTPYIPFYRLANYDNGDHFYTTDANEAQSAIDNFNYTYEGIAAYLSSGPGPQGAHIVKLFRLVNPQVGDHFYTTDPVEALNAASNLGYTYEDATLYVWDSPGPNLVPLYRRFNPQTGDHFYTTDGNEAQNAVANLGYRDEGVAAYVMPAPLVFSLSTPKSMYAVGEPIPFDIALGNRGSQPLTVMVGASMYELDVYDLSVPVRSGAEVWTAPRGRFPLSIQAITLAPGEVRHYTQTWAQRSDAATDAGAATLVPPGTYYAVARLANVPSADELGRQFSNPVVVRIQSTAGTCQPLEEDVIACPREATLTHPPDASWTAVGSATSDDGGAWRFNTTSNQDLIGAGLTYVRVTNDACGAPVDQVVAFEAQLQPTQAGDQSWGAKLTPAGAPARALTFDPNSGDVRFVPAPGGTLIDAALDGVPPDTTFVVCVRRP